MKLTVNDRAPSAMPNGANTLEDLLDALRSTGDIGDDQVVVGITVDRRSWSADDMDGLSTTTLTDVQEVAVSTTGMLGYAQRILTDARGMLDVLIEGSHRVADGLRRDSPDQANAHLFNLLNALQRFLGCLIHVQNACKLSSGLLSESAQTTLTSMSDGLEAIQAGQDSQDWDAVACNLERRLVPALQCVGGVMDSMKGELANA